MQTITSLKELYDIFDDLSPSSIASTIKLVTLVKETNSSKLKLERRILSPARIIKEDNFLIYQIFEDTGDSIKFDAPTESENDSLGIYVTHAEFGTVYYIIQAVLIEQVDMNDEHVLIYGDQTKIHLGSNETEVISVENALKDLHILM